MPGFDCGTCKPDPGSLIRNRPKLVSLPLTQGKKGP
jgi:hypothetical protein